MKVSIPEEYGDWLSARLQGVVLYVDVMPMSWSGERQGEIEVANVEGGSAVLAVVQTGVAASDLSGTWQWSSISVSDGNWNNAVEVSGTVHVAAAGSGYEVSGISGHVLSGLGISASVLHMALCDGRACRGLFCPGVGEGRGSLLWD